MYLESWQVFLGGCVIGTLISFIVLTTIIINVIGKIGIKGIKFHNITEVDEDYEEDEDDESTEEIDLLAKLSFILLNRGCISQEDVEFMMDHITFEEWKHFIEKEIGKLKEVDIKDEDHK